MVDNMPKRSRKYLLTFNNPKEHSFTHDMIKTLMQNFNYMYYCLCDEIGENGTYHTHLYFECKNAIGISKVKKIFPKVHYDIAHGSAEDNRNYIRKEGKYLKSDKKDTNLLETFEEYGIMPLTKSAKNETISEQVLEMLENGCEILEIIRSFPSYGTKIKQLEAIKQELFKEEFSNKWIDREVIYIYGETGTGKTRYVMDTYGYTNVCKVTNYKNPFDGYSNEEILLLDEFQGQIPFDDLLQYLDGYPCELPARYANKIACYNKVYIISNLSFDNQYQKVQKYRPESWNAFLRRITHIYRFEFNNDGDYPYTDSNSTVFIEEPKEMYKK